MTRFAASPRARIGDTFGLLITFGSQRFQTTQALLTDGLEAKSLRAGFLRTFLGVPSWSLWVLALV